MNPASSVLIFAIGNESRGDDALGPLLARDLQLWLESKGAADQVEIIEEFQLQIENTLDMQGREIVLFVDAGHKTQAPFQFYEAKPQKLHGHTTHAVAPETLLGIYADVHHHPSPPAFILCVSGENFELGEPLSQPAGVHLEQAAKFCRQLFDKTQYSEWLKSINS